VDFWFQLVTTTTFVSLKFLYGVKLSSCPGESPPPADGSCLSWLGVVVGGAVVTTRPLSEVTLLGKERKENGIQLLVSLSLEAKCQKVRDTSNDFLSLPISPFISFHYRRIPPMSILHLTGPILLSINWPQDTGVSFQFNSWAYASYIVERVQPRQQSRAWGYSQLRNRRNQKLLIKWTLSSPAEIYFLRSGDWVFGISFISPPISHPMLEI